MKRHRRTVKLLGIAPEFIPQTGLPVWDSYSFQRVARLGRGILPLSPGLRSTLGALGRMIFYLFPTCLPHLVATLNALGCMFLHLLPTCLHTCVPHFSPTLGQLPCFVAASDSFTSVWGQRWYIYIYIYFFFFKRPVSSWKNHWKWMDFSLWRHRLLGQGSHIALFLNGSLAFQFDLQSELPSGKPLYAAWRLESRNFQLWGWTNGLVFLMIFACFCCF